MFLFITNLNETLKKPNQAGREKTKQSGFLLAPHNVILFESLISNHAKK